MSQMKNVAVLVFESIHSMQEGSHKGEIGGIHMPPLPRVIIEGALKTFAGSGPEKKRTGGGVRIDSAS